jgi:hypothetical protein
LRFGRLPIADLNALSACLWRAAICLLASIGSNDLPHRRTFGRFDILRAVYTRTRFSDKSVHSFNLVARLAIAARKAAGFPSRAENRHQT